MAQAFAHVAEIQALSAELGDLPAAMLEPAKAELLSVARDVQRMQQKLVPVLSKETRNSITVEVEEGGMAASVGPTNRDKKGRPVGFFIEYGTAAQAPQPYVRPSAKWAEKNLPDRVGDALGRSFQ